jgi:hypothetical protein
MKQTAVEWFYEEIWKQFGFSCSSNILEKAKEMEKQHKYTEEDMLKCWNTAFTDAVNIDSETYKPIFYSDFINSLNKQDK